MASVEGECGFADLSEERQAYWEAQIRCTNIPSLFTGHSRGLDNLEALSPEDLQQRISRDPLLSSKLLSVANSTRMGKINPVRSVQKAISQLGLDLVLAIVLTYEMENDLQDGYPVSREVLHHIRNLASLSFAIAGIYARELRLPDGEAFCHAAMLSSVGSLLLAHTPKFDEATYLSFADEFQRLQYERSTWGVCVPTITQRMMEIWGLHEPVPLMVGSRHLPLLGPLPEGFSPMEAKQVCLLAAINALAHAYMAKQTITPEILLDRRNYVALKRNLLDHGMYVPVGRYWGQRSTETILRAAY